MDATALTPEQESAARAGAKAMMPVGRPFVEFVLSALADSGIVDVILVVAPADVAIREHFSRNPPRRIGVRFAVQDRPLGTANAVSAARDLVRDAPFLVLNGDNYYDTYVCREACSIAGSGVIAFEAESLIRESGIARERVARYALLDVGPDDCLLAIHEKPLPDHPLMRAEQRWVSMNLWSFTPAIFAACALVKPSPRGELELQSAVTTAMQEFGTCFRVIRTRAGVLDLAERADVEIVRARLAQMLPAL
jgi:glucose-1-phosphate thymidylyltransferase